MATIEIEDVRVVIWDVGGHVALPKLVSRVEVDEIDVEQVLPRLSWSDIPNRQQ